MTSISVLNNMSGKVLSPKYSTTQCIKNITNSVQNSTNNLPKSSGIKSCLSYIKKCCNKIYNVIKKLFNNIFSSKYKAITDFNHVPDVGEGKAVSMHHALNGRNSYYRDVMKDIKNGSIDEDTNLRSLRGILNTDKEFAKLKPLEQNCVVYRGRTKHPIIERLNADFKVVEDAKVGDVIVPDTGYSYCGFSESLAKVWHDTSEGSGLMYEIRLPKGAKVSRNLEHGGEVVMPRNAEYRIISKTKDDKGNIKVVMDYILPKKDNVAEIEELCKKYDVENIPFDPVNNI